MKKSSYLLGMLALGLVSLSSAAGCSSDDPAGGNTGGSSSGAGGGSTAGTGTAGTGTAGTGTAGTGTAGTGTAGPKMTGTMLKGTAAYTILMGADATAGAAAAPEAYTKSACGSCHGAAGQGVAQLGPEIRHAPAMYSTYVVRNGRPASIMAAFNETALASADLTAIQTWLAGQPKPTTGQGLYLDFCANCHGPTGGGGSVPVKASGLATAAINKVVRAGNGSDPGQRGLYMPAFGTDALSDGELSMIAQFLGGT